MSDTYEHSRPYGLTAVYYDEPSPSPLVQPYDLHAAFAVGHPDTIVTVAFQIAKPVLQAAISYSSPVMEASVFGQTGSQWQKAKCQPLANTSAWQAGEQYRNQQGQPWQAGAVVVDSINAVYEQADKLDIQPDMAWQAGQVVTQASNGRFGELLRLRLLLDAPWQPASMRTATGKEKFKDLLRRRPITSVRWQRGNSLTIGWSFRFSVADWVNAVNWLIWEKAQKPPIGRSKPAVVVPPKPPEYQGITLLNFACELCCVDPLHIQLNFGNDACPQNHKVIFIMNEVTFNRVSDSAPVDIISATVGIDMDSWCWSFSGEIPKTELAKIRPGGSGPVEVELSINGSLWRFIVESYDESKDFAKTTVAIRGRSVTAYLDAPYAPVRSYTQIDQAWSRALAEAELSRSGEASPFTINWQLIDELGWNVPANTFNYTSLTPVAAIKAIAESVGGYVNSDPAAKTLHVLPRFRFPAWQVNSQTVDKTVSYDFITHESLKWSETPEYNGIYVSGENTGVTALVKRTGTAGDNQAPMIVNQLVTDEAAARQLGTNELSKGGKHAAVSIDLPLVADIGLLLPSMLVGFELPCTGGTDLESWRGIVQGVSVSATQAKVIQTVDLLRRYDE